MRRTVAARFFALFRARLPMSARPAPFRMAPADVAWFRMESPTNPMTITGVVQFEGRLERAALCRFVAERLLPFDRFRMRVVRRGGSVWWVPDERFDVDRHVFETALPAPGGKAALEAFVSRQMSTQVPFDKPPWELYLMHDVDGGSALVVRLHHVIGDGIALMHVVLSSMDEFAGRGDAPADLASVLPARRPPPPLPRRLGRTLAEAARNTAALARHPGRIADAFRGGGKVGLALGHLLTMPPDSRTRFKGEVTRTKRAAWTRALALDDVRAVARATGAKINDVLLAAATGALRRYLDALGDDTRGVEIRAAVPFNVRPLERAHELGNAFGLVFLPLPLGEHGAPGRLRRLKASMDAIKQSAEPAVVFGILQSIGIAPRWVHRIVLGMFSAKASAVMTNVPGPDRRLHMMGAPIRTLMFWVPQAGDIGLGVSILSYDGAVRVGIAADAAYVPDPRVLVEAFEKEFADLFAHYVRAGGAPA